VPQATAHSSSFLHSLHVWRGRHHTKAINSMSDKDLDLKDRTKTETSLEVWNTGREYECSVHLYFGGRGGDEATRSENTTSIAQEAILQLQAPSIPTLLQSLLQRKACAVKAESSCSQQQQTMVVQTSSSPYSKAEIEMKSPRLDSSLQRQTIVVRTSSNPNPKAIRAFLASVGHRQWT
jgi:hypothetical protein